MVFKNGGWIVWIFSWFVLVFFLLEVLFKMFFQFVYWRVVIGWYFIWGMKFLRRGERKGGGLGSCERRGRGDME